jgi:hypothetical protein
VGEYVIIYRAEGRMFSSCTSYAAAATLKHYSAIEILDTRLIQDFLGPRNIQHTVKYTATNPRPPS